MSYNFQTTRGKIVVQRKVNQSIKWEENMETTEKHS